MSGSFENIDVPPTLVSFAVTTDTLDKVVSPEFKKAGSKVVLLSAKKTADGLIDTADLIENFRIIEKLNADGKVLSCYTLTYGGLAEAVMKMSFGNSIGFEFANVSLKDVFGYNYGAFVIELDGDGNVDKAVVIGKTNDCACIVYKGEKPVEYASVPLTMMDGGDYHKVEYTSISELLERYYAEKSAVSRINQKSTDLRKIISNALERSYRKLDLQQKQLKDTEKREKFRIYGDFPAGKRI